MAKSWSSQLLVEMFFSILFILFLSCNIRTSHQRTHPSSVLLEPASECWFLEMFWMPSNCNWTAAFVSLCQNFLFWLKKEEKEKLKNKWHVNLEFQNQSRSLPQRGGGGGWEEALSGGVLVKVICGFKLSQYDDVLRIQLFNSSSIAMDLTSKLDLNELWGFLNVNLSWTCIIILNKM